MGTLNIYPSFENKCLMSSQHCDVRENTEANKYNVMVMSPNIAAQTGHLSGVMPELVLWVDVEVSQMTKGVRVVHGVPRGKAEDRA